MYDFSQINDKDFELLVSDLLSKEIGYRVERFKPGKDSGVDGRFFSPEGNETIIQCKHYLKSGISKLINQLENSECQKVRGLNPSRYIFATSLPLSRANKQKISQIFAPYIRSESDVFGQEDLNQLLIDYPEVEVAHFKLWISSTTVLSRLLNNAVKGRSLYIIESIRSSSSKFVQTDDYRSASEILKSKGVLLISGEPGIGKTTLANNLCLRFVASGYEFVAVEESIREAEDVYEYEKRQVFYFDDFLGSNFLDAIEGRKDTHIMNFIDRVLHDNSKLLVMTSRTSILNSGVHISPVLETRSLKSQEFLLNIKSLNELDKAKILYNHIWFGDLSEDYIDQLYKEKRYKEIIKHRNFNPRLIEFITSMNRISVDAEGYWEYVKEQLADPSNIWSNCFNVQNNAYVRVLVHMVVFSRGIVSEIDLRRSYDSYRDLFSSEDTGVNYDFNAVSRLCVRAFLNRYRKDNSIFYTLFNPSVADFVNSELAHQVALVQKIVISLASEDALVHLDQLREHDRLTEAEYLSVIEYLLSKFSEGIDNDAFRIKILIRAMQQRLDEEVIADLFTKITVRDDRDIDVQDYFRVLLHCKDVVTPPDASLIKELLENSESRDTSMAMLSEVIQHFELYDADLIEARKEWILDYAENALNEAISEVNPGSHISYANEYDVSYDSDGLCQEVEESFRYHLEDILIGGFDTDIIDIEGYIDSRVDPDKIIDDFISGYEPDYERESSGGTSEMIVDSIDDLFERS